MVRPELPQAGLQALGAFIRSRREQAELSLRELAKRTNVSNPYLSQLERGLHEPSARVLKSIAAALNVSAETLLAQAGWLDPQPASRRAEGAGSEPAGEVPDTVAVIGADPALDEAQKAALVALYRSYLETNRR